MFNRSDKVEELEDVSSKSFQTNVVGNIHLFNLFLPLVMKGKVKKVITISSGHADLDFINDFDIENSALYSASKAAMNVIVAKFNAQYRKDGVLFVSISPGAVEVGHFENGTYPLSSRLKHLDILLMQIYSHSRTDPRLDGIYGQTFKLCPSLQGPNPRRRSRPKSQVDMGEGQHRQWVWWCIYLAFWKQAVAVNLESRSIRSDILIDVGVRYTYIHVHFTTPSYMSINQISDVH